MQTRKERLNGNMQSACRLMNKSDSPPKDANEKNPQANRHKYLRGESLVCRLCKGDTRG